MQAHERTFEGSEGTIFYRVWLPDGGPRRIVVLVHGYAHLLLSNVIGLGRIADRGHGWLDSGLAHCATALGLALQLGPAPSEWVLAALLASAGSLAQRGDAQALSTLGPCLVDLVRRVRRSGGGEF